MNKMKEVAELLGVELGEVFDILINDRIVKGYHINEKRVKQFRM